MFGLEFVTVPGGIEVVEASTPGQYHCNLPPLGGLECALQYRHIALHPRDHDVVVTRGWHSLAASIGNIGNSTQIKILGDVQAILATFLVRNRVISEARHSQALGRGNQKRFQVDRLSIRGFRYLRSHDRAANR